MNSNGLFKGPQLFVFVVVLPKRFVCQIATAYSKCHGKGLTFCLGLAPNYTGNKGVIVTIERERWAFSGGGLMLVDTYTVPGRV